MGAGAGEGRRREVRGDEAAAGGAGRGAGGSEPGVPPLAQSNPEPGHMIREA